MAEEKLESYLNERTLFRTKKRQEGFASGWKQMPFGLECKFLWKTWNCFHFLPTLCESIFSSPIDEESFECRACLKGYLHGFTVTNKTRGLGKEQLLHNCVKLPCWGCGLMPLGLSSVDTQMKFSHSIRLYRVATKNGYITLQGHNF